MTLSCIYSQNIQAVTITYVIAFFFDMSPCTDKRDFLESHQSDLVIGALL